ncbi:MAG: hypothetical protein AB7F31_06925 [Parachlamydiales bacterium]
MTRIDDASRFLQENPIAFGALQVGGLGLVVLGLVRPFLPLGPISPLTKRAIFILPGALLLIGSQALHDRRIEETEIPPSTTQPLPPLTSFSVVIPQDYRAFREQTDHMVELTASRATVAEHPAILLKQLAPLILHALGSVDDTFSFPNLRLYFEKEKGIGEGVTRDLLTDLFQGLPQKLGMKQAPSSTRYIPDGDSDLDAYEAWGIMLPLFYYSQYVLYSSPLILDESVITTAFQFTDDELAAPLENLSQRRRLELYRILIESQGLRIKTDEAFEALKRGEEEANRYAEEFLGGISITEYLLDVFERNGADKQLPAIHALARGMKRASDTQKGWKALRKIDPSTFSDKAQGTEDRSTIANAFCYSDENESLGHTYAMWIREWILEEASPKELRFMLQYLTGGASLPPNVKITVTADSDKRRKECYVTTCERTIAFPGYYMANMCKSEFIAYFKEQVLNKSGFNGY